MTIWHRGRLIDHCHIKTADIAASRRFYAAALGALGLAVTDAHGEDFVCDELYVSPGAPTQALHLAFQAADRETVHRFHAAVLAAGGRDNGGPGERAYHPGYYAAFALDPDGNNIEAVHHGPARRSAASVEIVAESETPPALPGRVNLVTLGVADVAASTAFYRRLGWRRSDAASQEGISFFDLDGIVLAIFGREALAEDAGIAAGGANAVPATALAINLPSEAAVDAAFAAALAAGAAPAKPPERVFWGGYSGYFADPDGHLWELAYNPFFPLDGTGRVMLPE